MSKSKLQETANPISNVSNTVSEATAPKVANIKKTNLQQLPFLFDKQNYILMMVGLGVIILGYILMSGGRSKDPNVFDDAAIYSFTRITLAPILVLLGLAIEGYAIMRKPK